MLAKKKLILWCGGLALVTLCSACGSPASLTLKLTPGQKRVIEVTTNMTGGEMLQEPDGTQRISLEVKEVDASGTATIDVGIDSSDAMGEMGPILAQMGEDNEFFSRFRQMDFQMKLAADGTLQEVSGANEIGEALGQAMQKLMEQMAGSNPQVKQMMRAIGKDMTVEIAKTKRLLKELVNNNTMKGELQNLTAHCSAEPRKVGDTWSRSFVLMQPFLTKVTTHYTLDSREDGIAHLSFTTQTETDPGTETNCMGKKATIQVKSECSGTLEVDEATGWPINGEGTVKKTGKVTMEGSQIPIDAHGAINVSSRAQ